MPDDGSMPFQMQATGIQVATPEVLSIVTGTGKGVQVPFGGVDSGDYFPPPPLLPYPHPSKIFFPLFPLLLGLNLGDGG